MKINKEINYTGVLSELVSKALFNARLEEQKRLIKQGYSYHDKQVKCTPLCQFEDKDNTALEIQAHEHFRTAYALLAKRYDVDIEPKTDKEENK